MWHSSPGYYGVWPGQLPGLPNMGFTNLCFSKSRACPILWPKGFGQNWKSSHNTSFPQLKTLSWFLIAHKIKWQFSNTTYKGLCSFIRASVSPASSLTTLPFSLCVKHTSCTASFPSHLPHYLLPWELLSGPLFSLLLSHILVNWYLYPQNHPPKPPITPYTYSESDNFIF